MGEFEVERDFPCPDLECMASPSLVGVASEMTSDWIDAMTTSLFKEALSELADGCDQSVVSSVERRLTWKTTGWNEVDEVDARDGCRSNQVWDLMDGEVVVGKLVVQRVPISEV
jgi:hypothetical protein